MSFIYLASPYSHDDPAVMQQRYEAVCTVAAALMEYDINIFCPIAHSHVICEHGNLPRDWDYWRAVDLPYIDAATELWVCKLDGWERSVGVQAEIEYAVAQHKPVRYVDARTFGVGPDVLPEVEPEPEFDEAAARKRVPVATGCIDYFPDALRAVARLSYVGNEQHNPGAPLHWDRSKSGDEADALMRHFVDRGTLDTDGVRHTTKVAWRALALLQKELEGGGDHDC